MFYQIFLFQSDSGILFWSKTFENLSQVKEELFSSFFSAIQSFVKEIIAGGSELKNIEMGNYLIKVVKDKKMGIDCVMIADKEDEKKLNKVIPKIMKIVQSHENLFKSWDGNQSMFHSLGIELISTLQKEKDLFEGDNHKTLIDGQDIILNSILATKPDMDPEKRKELVMERRDLEKKLTESISLLEKQKVINRLYEIAETLKDIEGIKVIQERKKKNLIEINETKVRIVHFLEELKGSLNGAILHSKSLPLHEIDFKQAYIDLYSLSTKLKQFGKDDLAYEFKEYANILLEKPKDKINSISEFIGKILNLNEKTFV